MDSDGWLKLLVVLLLIGLNAVLSAAELAVIELSENKLKASAKEGNNNARLLLSMKEDPGNFLSTIQIGITIVGLLSGAVAVESFSSSIVSYFKSLGLSSALLTIISAVSILLVTVILSFFTIVFGELVPKRLALKRKEKVAYKLARPVRMLGIAARPFVWLLSGSTNVILKLLGIDPSEEDEPVTEEEIMLLMQEGNEQGSIHDTEVSVLSNLFEFTDMRVEEVMTHRTEIQGVPADCKLTDAVDLLFMTQHKWYPVYENNLDNIVGFFYIYDVSDIYLKDREDKKNLKVSDVMRPAYFVSENKLIVELFDQMRKGKNKLAIAVDEYGGTSGLITQTDIVEALLGELDEDGEDEQEIVPSGKGYVMDGLVDFDEIVEFLNLTPPEEEYETLSGFMIDVLGYVPAYDEKPSISYGDYTFTVRKMAGAHIEAIYVSKNET